MERPSRARLLVVLAVLLCVAGAGLIARPPDTPPAIKQTEGWHEWWWTSDRVEDPLYRSPRPLDAAGAQRWELSEDSRIEVLFRLDLTRDIFAPFAARATGHVELDTLDLDGLRFMKMEEFRNTYRQTVDCLLIDDIQFLSGKDRSQEEFFQQGAGDVFATLDDSVRRLEVGLESARLGTAPRYPGATARGDLLMRLPGGRDTTRADVVVTRVGPDRIQVRTLDPIGCSLPRGFDRLAVLAEGWGVPVVPREIAIQLRLELIRGTS